VSTGIVGATTGTLSMFGRVTADSISGLGKLFSPNGLHQYVDTVTGKQGTSSGTTGSTSGSADANRPSSVVGIVQVGARSAQDGVAVLLTFLAAINIFIGIFNLIPLLPFDGGHVAIATYEAIRSRKGKRYYADVSKLLPVTYAVVIVLGLLFISSLYLDIARPIGG
jgi:membrane-associated protease RseP (regulator of RpoE activity)